MRLVPLCYMIHDECVHVVPGPSLILCVGLLEEYNVLIYWKLKSMLCNCGV